jgi:DNA adenine methylase
MVAQMRLPQFDVSDLEQVVNVAAVRQRSPFRYPGGKTWLIPRVQAWLHSLDEKPSVFLEPFAGGGIVGLTVAAEQLAQQVIIVELDEDVAAVWQTLIYGDIEWLAERILRFEMTAESIQAELASPLADTASRAFRTILRNRINHGGILAPGSGLIKYGENGKGVRSRWYPQTLARRIREIGRYRDRITFIQGDGIQALEERADDRRLAAFVDPPYTAAGKRAGSRLYTHFELDHESLFAVVTRLKGDFLMTYDISDEIQQLASKHGFHFRTVAMNNTHHAKMNELLIGRDLRWCLS